MRAQNYPVLVPRHLNRFVPTSEGHVFWDVRAESTESHRVGRSPAQDAVTNLRKREYFTTDRLFA